MSNADVVHSFADAIWNKQQLHRFPEFMWEDVRLCGLGDEAPIVGIDQLVTETARWLGLYSAVQMKVIRTVAEEDRIAWQWQLTGTVVEPRLASPRAPKPEDNGPWGQEVVVNGISISTFRDGRIAEEVTQSGVAEFLGQLGYPPKAAG
ncbi:MULTISPECIES: ester cyclase [unclassified Crossiella]|uniref:ester cyclase n=1 Tax=unclassified Crossiella TaxID=2620835 RepID=UPI001FFFD67B|nr:MULTISPECIES: ester cyclase [unclassified Crossiella]MCK2242094.1 ester cyclase [Crossiella sp. S99.2]MCK2255997.1 ester cyclase [Crossiella sp. S99.1]